MFPASTVTGSGPGTRAGRTGRVTAIYEHWRLSDEWWGSEVRRDYFRIETGKGLVYDIYHDTVADRWYLGRVQD